MIAQIISTGDEVLLGDIVDTNAAFLCAALTRENIRVAGVQTVLDDLEDISCALTRAAERADICVVTGGLGATEDDLTLAACANVCGEPLVLNPLALSSMTSYMEEKGYVMGPENEKQAMLPASAKVLVNQWGSAPGFCLSIGKCLCFFLPGVPGEMKPMFETRVLPQIRSLLLKRGNKPQAIHRFTVFGLGESGSAKLVTDFPDRFPDIRLGFRAAFPCIELRLSASQDNPRLAQATKLIQERFAEKIVSVHGLSLEAQVGKLLEQKGQTLALAESCTGGLVSNWLTNVPGSSAWFLLGAVTYANHAKESVLGVSSETLQACGAVHEQTALEMALGAKKAANAHWGLSTTGIAGPGGGTEQKPVGTVCIGLAGPGNLALSSRHEFHFADRFQNKQMFAATALDLLRRQLLS